MILSVSATGTHSIAVFTILYRLLDAEVDISNQNPVFNMKDRKNLEFSLSFNIVVHPFYQVLVSQWCRARRTIDISSFLDHIVDDFAQVFGT